MEILFDSHLSQYSKIDVLGLSADLDGLSIHRNARTFIQKNNEITAFADVFNRASGGPVVKGGKINRCKWKGGCNFNIISLNPCHTIFKRFKVIRGFFIVRLK